MYFPQSSFLFLAALLLPSTLAQVPASLSKGFDTEMQVNFQGDSALGFKDGDTIPFQDTANEPVFALGDSSGVNTAISFMVMMLDTTDENNFIMHYMEADFKATGVKTGLDASGEPQIPYAKPGSFGESGERQYTFLLFQLKRNSEVKSMPNAGEKFDYEAFSQANGLEPPNAGVAMKVSVGETSGQGASPGQGASSGQDAASGQNASSAQDAAPVKPGDGATPTTSTETKTMTSASESPSDSSMGANGTSTEGKIVKMKKPSGKSVGGGIVSEKPYPPADAGADAAVNPDNTAMPVRRGETVGETVSDTIDSGVSAAKAELDQGNGAGVVVVRAGASMAAMAVTVGFVALI